jgi:hypothetical protein
MKAHFIELDIILKTNAKPWIVDKTKPNIPIMKMENSDFNLFKSGIFKSQGNKINFNGKNFWLSNDFMNKLKIKAKNYKSDISNLGISMQEFLNSEITEDIKYEIDTNLFNSIVNTNDDIYIICSKNTKNNFEKQISKLEEKLAEIGLQVKNYYYISETFYNKNEDDIAYTKGKLIIQHLLGIKAEGDKFINEEITNYSQITFYDDNVKSIQICKNINDVLEKLLIKTDDVVKMIIKDKLKNKDNSLIIKEITHNNVNRYKEYSIELKYSNIIKNFENYNQ